MNEVQSDRTPGAAQSLTRATPSSPSSPRWSHVAPQDADREDVHPLAAGTVPPTAERPPSPTIMVTELCPEKQQGQIPPSPGGGGIRH